MEKKDFQIIQKIGEDEFLLIHPETSADNVLVDVEGIEAKDAAGAIAELNENIQSIVGGTNVVGVKGEAEETFRSGKVNITKGNIGLGNVDNTSDTDKPISTAQQEALDLKADKTEIPDVSEFITKAVNDLTHYYTKESIDETVEDLESKISAIPKFSIEVVDSLPTADISDTVIYLLKTSESETGNLYTEYIYTNSMWEVLGTQTVNLTGYATEDWVNTQIADFIMEKQVNEIVATALADYAKTADLGALAFKDKLALTVSGDVSGSVELDGEDGALELTLSDTGVSAGVYSAVSVDSKGRVTAGAQVVEIGAAGQDKPSTNLAIGGLFFKQI